MAIKKIRMRPEGANDYADVLHPETSAEQVKLSSSSFTSTDVKGGMDELFQNVSNGKNVVATAITGKGITASGSETFPSLAGKISNIETQSILTGNATAIQVLTGRLFYSNNPNSRLTGTMPNRGAPAQILTTQGGQYNIPAGYFSGGSVKATFANLSAGNIKSGVSVGGVVGNLIPFSGGVVGGSGSLSTYAKTINVTYTGTLVGICVAVSAQGFDTSSMQHGGSPSMSFGVNGASATARASAKGDSVSSSISATKGTGSSFDVTLTFSGDGFAEGRVIVITM